MIDHCGIHVMEEHFDKVVSFYTDALAPLGYTKMFEYPGHAVGFGDGKADFWVGKTEDAGNRGVQHIAFCAKDQAAVQKFHEIAVGAGAKDNGQPGPRFGFPKEYYASYVLDPLGNNIEAAFRSE